MLMGQKVGESGSAVGRQVASGWVSKVKFAVSADGILTRRIPG